MDSTETLDLDALEAEVMEFEAERAVLDAQIDALIRRASERLRQQLAELHRDPESEHEQVQEFEAIAD